MAWSLPPSQSVSHRFCALDSSGSGDCLIYGLGQPVSRFVLPVLFPLLGTDQSAVDIHFIIRIDVLLFADVCVHMFQVRSRKRAQRTDGRVRLRKERR